MAKIAVECTAVVERREPAMAANHLACRLLAQGAGWNVADMVCTAGPRDRVFEEQHGDFNIAIVVSGTFQYRGAPGRELMTPGSLMLGNQGEYYECGHEHGVGDRCLSFQFSREYFERLTRNIARRGMRAGFAMLRLPPLRELSPLVSRACAALTTSEDAGWEEISMEIAAKTLCLAHEGGSTEPYAAKPSELARATRVVRMIEREGDGELSLAALAQEAGLSPFHFLRSFQQLTGLTPHQYVRRARLRQAAMLLASGRDSVLNIALECGFGDVSNFNRAFGAEFGCSPLAYRRQA